MNNSWQYDEKIQVGTDYRDPKEVWAYDEQMLMLRDIDTEVKDIRNALLLSADSTVWEIGTGTGECALALADGVKHVYATDVSPAMLDYARHKAKWYNKSAMRYCTALSHQNSYKNTARFYPAAFIPAILLKFPFRHLQRFPSVLPASCNQAVSDS